MSIKIKQRRRDASRRPAFSFDIARRYAEHATGNRDMQSMLPAFSYEPCLVNAGSHARRYIDREVFGLYTEALWVYRPSGSGSIDRRALGLYTDGHDAAGSLGKAYGIYPTRLSGQGFAIHATGAEMTYKQ